MAWKEKWGYLADRKTEMASKVGTEFHAAVEVYLDKGCYAPNPGISSNMMRRIDGMMGSFIEWAKTVDGVIHYTELKVISHKYAYSGTLDAVGTFEGKPMILDWKTSSKIYPDMDLQLAAYAQAYKEQTGVNLKEGMIVHVSKDKPRFKLTTKVFKLGKRPLSKFLKLRANFDDVNHLPVTIGGTDEKVAI